MIDRASHWEDIYAMRHAHEVSWYQIHPDTSLRLIAKLHLQPGDAIIDVGGGASSLVDHLLDQGFVDLSVLDISVAALDAVKARLNIPRFGGVGPCHDFTELLQQHTGSARSPGHAPGSSRACSSQADVIMRWSCVSHKRSRVLLASVQTIQRMQRAYRKLCIHSIDQNADFNLRG